MPDHFFKRKIASSIFSFKKILFLLFFFSGILFFSSCLDKLFEPHNDFPCAKDILNDTCSKSTRFFVLSDWGFNGNFEQKKVAQQMAQISRQVGIDFILTSGDNFQYNGVPSSTDSLWKINYENVYNDSSLQVPWYPALGNHDYYGNPEAEIEYSNLNSHWNLPSRYYSFTKTLDNNEKALFIILDTQGLINDYHNLVDTMQTDSVAEVKWLRTTLSTNPAKWIFVVGHHPIYSAASNYHGDTYEMKKIVKPILEQFKIDFYICGHDHHFEHAKDSASNINYIVTGTGAYPRPVSSNGHSIYTLSEAGFSYFNIYNNVTTLYFITENGGVGYSFSLQK